MPHFVLVYLVKVCLVHHFSTVLTDLHINLSKTTSNEVEKQLQLSHFVSVHLINSSFYAWQTCLLMKFSIDEDNIPLAELYENCICMAAICLIMSKCSHTFQFAVNKKLEISAASIISSKKLQKKTLLTKKVKMKEERVWNFFSYAQGDGGYSLSILEMVHSRSTRFNL